MLMIKVVKAIIVRAALLLHLTMTVWRVTVDLKDDMYWLMFCATLPFVIESFYTVIKRKGDDFLLFTPCFFFYLLTTIPCVWLLELRKTDVYLSGEEKTLFNNTQEEPPIVEAFGDINPNTWTILIEELLLYLLIVGRWLLPRGQVTREQLSELLFAFIGIASDIMEMFSLFGEKQVRSNRTLSYCILSVWSISVTQFCMTLTVTHKPRKAKNIKVIDDNEDPEKKKATISHEIIAIILSMVMQDLPFVTVRLYTIITYDLITYSLIFFTSKNCLVICLLIYKIAVLIQKRYCPENVHEEMEEDNELYMIGDDDRDGRRGKRSELKLDLNDTGSASTGGSKEKHRLEKYYEENENDKSQVRERKNKNVDDIKNDKGLPESPSFSKLDKSPATSSSNTESSPNKPQPKRSPNEKTPLNPPSKSPQMPQSTSTPSLTKRSPTGSSPGTPKSPEKSSGANTPRSSTTSRPRPSPSKAPTNQPKMKPSPKHQQLPKLPQQQPPLPPQPASDPPIASGFGWISSKPKDDTDDVIVAGLS